MKNQDFIIIAPKNSDSGHVFPNASIDRHLHAKVLSGIRSVREHALRESVGNVFGSAAASRHLQEVDSQSWHVVLRDKSEHVLGCARYRPISGGFEEFRVSQSSVARSLRYGPMLRASLETLLGTVRRRGMDYGEAGGWALRPEVRGTTAGFNVALMSYALGEHLGSGLAVSTATRSNQSSSILRRIGAQRLAGFPAYWEPQFASIMEIVHFDLPCLNALYGSKLTSLRQQLRDVQVVCAGPVAPVWAQRSYTASAERMSA